MPKKTAPSTKQEAQAAKKIVSERLSEAGVSAAVGLSHNEEEGYVVAIRLQSKPTKKLLASLSKKLNVAISVEVVEAAVALKKE